MKHTKMIKLGNYIYFSFHQNYENIMKTNYEYSIENPFFLYYLDRNCSLLSFIWDEIERDYLLEQNEKKLKERRKRVYTFFKTPQHLEKVENTKYISSFLIHQSRFCLSSL